MIIIYYDGGGGDGRPTGDLHARVTFIARRPCTFPDEFCVVCARSRAISLKNIDVCLRTRRVMCIARPSTGRRVASDPKRYYGFFFIAFFFLFVLFSSSLPARVLAHSGSSSELPSQHPVVDRPKTVCVSLYQNKYDGLLSFKRYFYTIIINNIPVSSSLLSSHII